MISCVYCGGAHERPADVKRCWADQQSGNQSAGPSRSDPARPDDDAAPPAPPPAEPLFESRPTSSAPSTTSTSSTAVRRRPAGRPVAPATRAQASVALRRGPHALGRNVVVEAGAVAPPEWFDATRITIDESVLASPAEMLDQVRTAAASATGVVFELAAAFDDPPAQVDTRPAYEVGVEHEFLLDELHHLVWSNAVDARDDEHPRWLLVDQALAAGASAGGDADVTAADGRPLWLDGGPTRHHASIDGVDVVGRVAIEHGSLTGPGPNDSTAELAPDQLAAVTHGTGSARIIAPAGSGKTRVLTERARHLVTRWNVPPSAICLVAFNKRAQIEMAERLADVDGVQVRTLNSIALAIVNGTPPFAPTAGRRTTIDEPEVRRVIQRFVQTPRRRNVDPIAPWIEALSLVRLGLVPPEQAEMRYGGDVDGLAQMYPRFRAELDRGGVVDFDGQIDLAIATLLADPAARRAAQRACRLLLVDEFQDLTPAHLLLVRLLGAGGGSVFGVGDDDQTIYGYNGADPGWLIDYARWFPGAGDHPLEVNYRCPEPVVEVADRLLRHNRRRVDKTIRARPDAPGTWTVDDGDDTVATTVAAVRAAIDTGASPADVAVLTRVNALLAPVQVALGAAGIGVHGGVGTEFADRTSVRAALAWLRLASGRPFAPDDLIEAMRRPSRSLHPRIMEWVTEQGDPDSLQRLADRLNNERDAEKLGEFVGDIRRLTAMVRRRAPTDRIIATLVDDIGLGGAVSTLDDTRHGMNRGAQGDDLTALRQLAALHAASGADDGFESWLRGSLGARRPSAGVTLATVHRVKGQEWPHVVVHQAASDQFPHRLADDHEEERRLFHVAITRASQSLTVVPGGTPSPFVDELTTEPPDPSELHPEPPRPQRAERVTKAKRTAPDHPLLDRGTVIAVAGLTIVDQGQEWVVTAIEPDAAVAERNGSTRRFRIGASVETIGKQRGKLGARPGQVDAGSVVVFDLLRRFRDRARNGKPAYTVFDDKTLAAIADRRPTSLDELARVKGVGPAKLEQYGESVLAVVGDAMTPPQPD
ncbi:ATP-dependent DNA helicase UvrD2 [Ilumatobacter fluminis]|uniref:ATP-dependent DNA helicase UvrD2 n=1 Tax=Ilumatobacter fluminis TaxID=467091 RepID=UPI001415091C|nr:ATP-dependent DNA helicase UvrD2 [Ilumatobacter fluminis]